MKAKKKAKKPNQTKKIVNRRARHDYAVDDSIVVGMALTGAETKSLRMGHGQLRGAYVTLKDGELWLLNATITGSAGIPMPEDQQTRTRKLLAKRKEIDKLAAAKQQGLALIPLEILTGGRYIKLRIAAARGQKKYDKRETIKKRDQIRQNDRELRRL